MDKEKKLAFLDSMLKDTEEWINGLDEGLDELFNDVVAAWKDRDLSSEASIIKVEQAAKGFAGMIFALRDHVETKELTLKEIENAKGKEE